MTQRGDAHRDLLFVLLGIQTGKLERNALIDAFQEWDWFGQRPLVEDLLRRGLIAEEDLTAIERLVDERLRAQSVETQSTLPIVGGSENSALSETLGARTGLSPTIFDAGQTLSDRPERSDFLPSWVQAPVGENGPHGRYQLIRPHAEGGLGIVSLARDTELNREVALKEIKSRYADDPTSQSRFMLEAEVTGRLEHPGIVPVYGLGVDPHGRPYYAMRFIRGESLKDVIAHFHAEDSLKRAPGARGLELRKLLRRFLDVCNTVEYAHTKNVLHRDIKPANIMVGPHGETLVVDWGIAKATWRSDHPLPTSLGEKPLSLKSVSGITETLPGSTLGTPAFMSAEQAKGDLEKLGPPSDVYSLGATLYNLLTGRPAFEQEDVRSILLAVESGDFPPPRKHDRTIAPALEAICLKAMKLDPVHRYSTARMLADDVERWMADEPVTALPDPFIDRARRWMRHRRTAVTAATVAMLMAVAALVVVLVVQRKANQDLSLANAREHERFELAMEAISTLHTGVSEDFLLQQKEFKNLRDKLLNKAKEFYRRLEDKLKDQSDTASRESLAGALYEVGELTSKVGVKTDALASHRESLTIRRNLAYGSDSTTQMKLDLGRSLTAIAAIEQTVNGMQPGAERDYEEALSILDPLSRHRSDDPGILAALARLERRYGQLLADTNRHERARMMYDRSMSLWEKVVQREPSNIAAMSEKASCHHQLGDLLARQSPTDALAEYEKARQIRRRIAADNPTLLQVRADLASSDNTIGRLLANHAKTDEALERLRSSLATRKELAREHSGVTDFHVAVARSYHVIATVLSKNGRTDAALEAYREAKDIRRELVRDNPTVPLFKMDLAAASFDMASILYILGRIDEAISAFTEARTLEQKVVDENPNVPRFRRDLALSHLAFGKILADTTLVSGAIESYEKARDILKNLSELERTNKEYALELAICYQMLSELFGSNGQPKAALENDALARSILESLLVERATDTRPKKYLALCDLGSGTLLLSEGRYEQARDRLQNAKKALLSLLESERNQTNYRQALGMTEDAIASLEARTDRPLQALSANERAREAWTSLLMIEASNFENREGEAENLRGLGECLRHSGQLEKASTVYEAARTIAESLARANPRVRRFQIQLASSEKELGAALAMSGQQERALIALNHAIEILDRTSQLGAGEQFLKTCAGALIFGLTHRREAANEAERALRRAFESGFRDFDVIRVNRDLEPIRSLPEIQRLMDEYGFPVHPFVEPESGREPGPFIIKNNSS